MNKVQQTAINFTEGPLLVVAGAGTGKTKVIVERIARLVERGVPKSQILALTFTEKAAQEMRDRVGELLPHSFGVEMPIYTFNGFGQEILREFAVEIGRSPTMQLIGDSGKIVLLRAHIDELELDYFAPVSAPDSQLGTIGEYFSKLKQQIIRPKDYSDYVRNLPVEDEADQLEKQRHSELAKAYSAYIDIARNNNIIDYDDQIYLLIELLEKRPNIARKLQDRYQYILVDEFQDTNPMQSRLLDLLAQSHQNIMVVGDDDQSIYGWRGATLANILDFTKRYPDAAEITLTENFRSTQEILDAAYRMIQCNNPDRLEAIHGLDKRLVAARKAGVNPSVYKFADMETELDWVTSDIKKRIAEGTDPGSIAVLLRRNSGVRNMHAVLESNGVEHAVAGVSSDIYRQPIIGTMIEALKTVVDPHDDQALYHTLTGALFKLNAAEIGQIAARGRRSHQRLESLLLETDHDDYTLALDRINAWRENVHETSIGAMAYAILSDSGFKDELYRQAEHDEQQAFNVQVLGKWFLTLRDFSNVASVTTTPIYLQNLDALRAEGEMASEDTATEPANMPIVMSVHRAKGLEWDIVYIVDCTEGSFPLKRHGSSMSIPETLSKTTQADDHYNEERRLMYVAATRARNELILTFAETHGGNLGRKPSRFLNELFQSETAETVLTAAKQTSLEFFSPYTKNEHITLPEKMISGDKLVLTASQVVDYLRCPLDFKYKHILGVPPAPDPNRSVGTLIHSLIQQVNEAKINGGVLPTITDLLDSLEARWPLEGYLSALQRDRSRKQAVGAFTAYYQRLIAEPPPLISEEPFRILIPDSKLILTGRIDAVLQHDTGVEIRDYKTSTSAQTAEKAKKSAQASKQLDIYALAWLTKTDEMPALVSLDFVLTGQVGTVKKQAKTLINLRTKLSTVADDILAGKFPAGREHRYCIHPLTAHDS